MTTNSSGNIATGATGTVLIGEGVGTAGAFSATPSGLTSLGVANTTFSAAGGNDDWASTTGINIAAAMGIDLAPGAGYVISLTNSGAVAPLAFYNAAATHYISLQAGAMTGDCPYTLPTAYPGVTGYVLSSTTGGTMSWVANGSGGSGTAITNSITQVAHGFSVGNVLYFNGTAFALAEATTAALAEVVGIVSSVTSSSVFVLTMYGYVTGLSGLTAGDFYYLSDSSAGAMQNSEPTTVGHISKPLLEADTTTSGYFINYRGKVIPNSSSAIIWNSAASTPITLAAYNGYTCNNGSTQIVFDVPATTAVGDTYIIAGTSTGGWQVQMNTGQTANLGAAATSSGGTITSNNSFDSLTLVCTVASTTFVGIGGWGNLTCA